MPYFAADAHKSGKKGYVIVPQSRLQPPKVPNLGLAGWVLAPRFRASWDLMLLLSDLLRLFLERLALCFGASGPRLVA